MLAERGETEEVPETLQGVIAARLDGLPPEEKALLQEAAVVGRVFWLGAVEAMDGALPRELEARLHALARKEFIRRERRSSVEGDTEFAFLHVLVRDVAYGQIPRRERSEKHRLAAEWIASLGRSEDHAEMLGHHYLQALELAEAAGADTVAAGRAGAPGAGRRGRPGRGALQPSKPPGVSTRRRCGCVRKTALNVRSCSTSEQSPRGRTSPAATPSN